jgi:hypothetical protein
VKSQGHQCGNGVDPQTQLTQFGVPTIISVTHSFKPVAVNAEYLCWSWHQDSPFQLQRIKCQYTTEKFIIPSGVLPAIRAMRDPKKLLRKKVSNSTGVQSCATSVDSGRSCWLADISTADDILFAGVHFTDMQQTPLVVGIS